MEKKDDKWIKKWRDRMENYSEPVPDDLWQQLEEELNAPRKVVPMWRRISAIAAVMLLAIAVSVTLRFRQSSSTDNPKQTAAKPAQTEQTDTGKASDLGVPEQRMAQEATSKNNRQARILPLLPEEPVSAEYAIPTEKDETEGQTDEAAGKQEENGETKENNRQWTTHSPRPNKGNNYARRASAGKKQNGNWTVGVSTGNGTFSSSNRMDGYVSLPRTAQGVMALSTSGEQTNIDKMVQCANIAEGESGESDVKYRMPVTFEVSVRRALTDHWAIEAGVFYTLLSSETTSGGEQNNYGWEDKLHYIGIPLKVSRDIWSNKHFDIYATAGGAVEKCVAGKQTVEWNTTSSVSNSNPEPVETDIKVKPLQWSVSVSAGAQYKLTENVGIYAEPGAVYYFDDGSSVNTIRKEHPFNLNLRFGLRLTLPK